MDASEVIRIADKHLPKMLWQLQLNMWTVRVDTASLQGMKASIRFEHEYENAVITIDPEQTQDERDVLDSLRHELFHIIHADFQLFRAVALQGVMQQDADAMDQVYDYACEKTVLRLERMFEHGLGSPDHMAVNNA